MDSQEPQGDVLARACAVIEDHGVVAYPTETFYGLAVSVLDPRGCARVFEIKGRAASKALPCIIADVEQLDRISPGVPGDLHELAARFWPGPLTLIVPARADVAAASESDTIAVRVSSLPLARALARRCGPVTSTSANASGAPPASTADEVLAQLTTLDPMLDLVLDGGPTSGGAASTIVDLTSGEPRLVREGAIAFRSIVPP